LALAGWGYEGDLGDLVSFLDDEEGGDSSAGGDGRMFRGGQGGESMVLKSYQGIPGARYISFSTIFILNIKWPFGRYLQFKKLNYFF
jgi:hypothetical protein